MSNSYPVEITALLDFQKLKISEGKFLTVLAEAERYFKEKLEHENIRCKRCQLIIGREFKLGVVIPNGLDYQRNLTFFAAHSMCIDERLHGKGHINEDGELEVNALTFLEVEKDIIRYQRDLESHLNMLDIENVDGELKVLMKYEKAGIGNEQLLIQAAMIRFEEIEKAGATIKCPMCKKGFKPEHERFIAFIPNGPKKYANIEMVHNHCSKKLRKFMKGRR
jgi:hypothetical protein